MKITMEVECTPEEARRFLGLPDVAPLQETAMEGLRARMAEAAAATSPEALLRAWMPLAPHLPEALMKAVGSALWAGTAAGEPGKAGGKPG